MQKHVEKSPVSSRRLERHPGTSGQPPLTEILQAYREGTLRERVMSPGGVGSAGIARNEDRLTAVPRRVVPGKAANAPVQRAPLSDYERAQLKIDLQTVEEIEADYENFEKELESFTDRSTAEWESFLSQVVDATAYYESFFSELREKKERAHLSRKAYDEFKKKLNEYMYSGGKNRLVNLRRSAKRLSKKVDSKVDLPSVVRFADYLVLVEELYKQMDFYRDKTSLVSFLSSLFPDPLPLEGEMKTLMDKIKAYGGGDVQPIRELHNQLCEKLKTYVAWLSPQKNLFIRLRWIDTKKKLKTGLLQEIGSINVASRSDKSEGFYMRSQEVHKMHIGKGEGNPFARRVGMYLAPDAHLYNIGGSKTEADVLLVQSDLREGRRRAYSSKIKGLRDDILEHKNICVAYMVGHFPACTHLKAPKAQVSARYPCVLILFEGALMTQVSQSKENIPEFLTHFLAGHINAALIRGRLRPLVERRQSFGFMTPTITDVHSGVRLSLGITPSKAWCEAVCQGIKSADADIGALCFGPLPKSPTPSAEVVSVSDALPVSDTVSGSREVPVSGVTGSGDKSSKLATPPEMLIMDKFNRGSVLGAGHKLITDKLLSNKAEMSEAEMSPSGSEAPMSISPKELNALFGKREGRKIVEDIEALPKPVFEGQEVDKDAIALYARLKSFYEHYLRRLHHSGEEKEVDWTKVDPAAILQELMDKCVEATYDDMDEVVGLDESSDDEDMTPSRVPSGMSALFLPLASYASCHSDGSILYDTAPYSYFEIDTSWNKTFEWDRIERRGVRYKLTPSVFRRKAKDIFDRLARQAVQEEKDRSRREIENLEDNKNEEEERLRDIFRDFVECMDKGDEEGCKRLAKQIEKETLRNIFERFVKSTENENKENSKRLGEEVEKEIQQLKAQTDRKIKAETTKSEKTIEQLATSTLAKTAELKKKLDVIMSLLARYLASKKEDLAQSSAESAEELALARDALNIFLDGLKGESEKPGPEGFVARSIGGAFETYGFDAMDRGVLATRESEVEIAFVDFNPCMTGEKKFDSGENLYRQTMEKYGKLRMIVVDITSATEKQVKELVALFRDQTVDRESQEIVPFLCMARSGTKHDQLGLDINTMGSCFYLMHPDFDGDETMNKEFKLLRQTSRTLSRNTEPVLVKKLRRDLREAARKSETKK